MRLVIRKNQNNELLGAAYPAATSAAEKHRQLNPRGPRAESGGPEVAWPLENVPPPSTSGCPSVVGNKSTGQEGEEGPEGKLGTENPQERALPTRRRAWGGRIRTPQSSSWKIHLCFEVLFVLRRVFSVTKKMHVH